MENADERHGLPIVFGHAPVYSPRSECCCLSGTLPMIPHTYVNGPLGAKAALPNEYKIVLDIQHEQHAHLNALSTSHCKTALHYRSRYGCHAARNGVRRVRKKKTDTDTKHGTHVCDTGVWYRKGEELENVCTYRKGDVGTYE